MIVFRRWATVRTVQSSNCVRIVDWMSVSVSRSTAAVASSKTRILVFLSKALARHTSWRWPRLHRQERGRITYIRFYLKLCDDIPMIIYWWLTKQNKWILVLLSTLQSVLSVYLRFSPPSEHSWLSLSGRLEIKFLRWASSSDLHTSSSV